MRMLLIVVAILIAAAAGAYVYGRSLPERHTVSVSRDLPAPPDRVYAAISDFEQHPAWRTGVKSVSIDRERQRVVEQNSFGELPYVIRTAEPPRLLVTEIDGGRKLGFGGTWRYVIEPRPSGSRLTITEDGIVFSPFFRIMSKFVFGHDKTARTYLADLEKRLALQ